MPKKAHQPRLISEPQSEYKLTPEEQARKSEYRERLLQQLQDPEFRQISGFPIGDDEAILDLSDPPHYTACPNPFLPEIIEAWQKERAEIRAEFGLSDDSQTHNTYHREPFAADVSEGKNNPIYNAHSYHTKVPHPAIMRYILHYTDPGDIVFDGFCGTGMTGVAAQLCQNREEVEKLDYHVDEEGRISEKIGDEKPISRLGTRKVVLNDLSPVATFIANNYNTPVDVNTFEDEALRILDSANEKIGWMYETWHPNCDDLDRVKTRIDYTVWSEVYICPNCNFEFTFSEFMLGEKGKIRDEFNCPNCDLTTPKRHLEVLFDTAIDPISGEITRFPKRVPYKIHYKVHKKKYNKVLDSADWTIITRIQSLPYPQEVPTNFMPDMQMMRVGRMKTVGIKNIHHFFINRSAHSLSYLWDQASQNPDKRLRDFLFFWIEQAIWGMSLLNRYTPTHFSMVNQYLSGVFYVSSHIAEVSPWYNLSGKQKRIAAAFRVINNQKGLSVISTEDLGSITIPSNSIDYIFTDPPFGENIYYSDLNSLIEAWHGVRTTPIKEAIVDRVKQKTFLDYERMMESCFLNYFQALKPGHWMTVEFHNSKNSVWNAIQQAILNAGFIIADVRILDKKQRSFQQILSSNAVKQDLVISAYKPHNDLKNSFQTHAGTAEGVWAFIRQHLAQLPVAVRTNGNLEALSERQAYLLFDRMVAFHIQRDATVPMSTAQFYAGLDEHFPKRDGMYFLPEQVPEFDRARLEAVRVAQLTFFVSDEKSAIQWLRQQLDPQLGGEPQTYQDLQPKFLRQLHQAKHEVLPELSKLLEQNLLQDQTGRWYVPDPNKASDLEQFRQQALLREFRTYFEGTKPLKQFRTEAVRAGFADAYQRRDFQTILKVAQRLPERVLQEDPDLLMYFDAAGLRGE